MNNPRRLPILEHASTLSDLTRCRALRLLERSELTVSELCAVLQLPQSTVSRHLRVLTDDGWLSSRREATNHLYQMATDTLEEPARRLWNLVREQLRSSRTSSQDAGRLQSVLAARRSRSAKFFAASASEWDLLRGELFGERFDLLALAALLDRSWVVGDLACGTGRVAAALAPFVSQVIAVDSSAAMLEAARARLDVADRVSVREGTLETLPLDDGELDAAMLFLALHHVPEPPQALAEAGRALRADGRLVVVDMMPHDREEYRAQMGHIWLGFEPTKVVRWLRAAGFDEIDHHPLPPVPEAKGPALFVMSARAGAGASNVKTRRKAGRTRRAGGRSPSSNPKTRKE